jgi:glycosyltransferase involved in cell wall biosynthesis
MMSFSFVIPVFNEEHSLCELYEQIAMQMSVVDDYEVIFIDDGSNDSSFEVIQQLVQKDSRIKGLKLRRNFGKSVALDEGFKFAQGDIIITLDADLQDDPGEVPRLIALLKEGYDLVSGWKQQRKDNVLSKNIPSIFFNYMIGMISGLRLHDYNCGLKVYSKRLVKRLSLYGDLHRYIPAIAHSLGFKVTELPVVHHPRQYGKSKYGIERFSHGLFDFITIIFLTRYLKRPMHFFGWFGLLFFASGFGVCSYLTVLWLTGEKIGTRPLLILGVLLILVGIQFVFTGLIAEMITYSSQKQAGEDIVETIAVQNLPKSSDVTYDYIE